MLDKMYEIVDSNDIDLVMSKLKDKEFRELNDLYIYVDDEEGYFDFYRFDIENNRVISKIRGSSEIVRDELLEFNKEEKVISIISIFIHLKFWSQEFMKICKIFTLSNHISRHYSIAIEVIKGV